MREGGGTLREERVKHSTMAQHVAGGQRRKGRWRDVDGRKWEALDDRIARRCGKVTRLVESTRRWHSTVREGGGTLTRKLEARNNDTARWSYGAEVGRKHSKTAQHVAGRWRDAGGRKGKALKHVAVR